jgi:hypothetical protein
VKPAAEAEAAQGAPVLTQGEEIAHSPPVVPEDLTLLLEPLLHTLRAVKAGRALELRIVEIAVPIAAREDTAETVAMIQSVVRVATAVQEL